MNRSLKLVTSIVVSEDITIKQEINKVSLFTPLPMDTHWISAFLNHCSYSYYHVSRAELRYFLALQNTEFLQKIGQQSNIEIILHRQKRNCIAWNWGKTKPIPWKFWASPCSREPYDRRSVVFFPNNRILNRKNVEKVWLDFLSFCAVLSPKAS